MAKNLFIVIITGILLGACNSSSKTSQQIDYAKLDSLKTNVVLEIGESEHFLPGRLRDLVAFSDGSILVSDMGSVSITQFDAKGNYEATIAKKGSGPGELGNYFSMWKAGADTLLVRQNSNVKLYFGRDSKGVFYYVRSTVPKKYAKRPLFFLSPQTDTTYYALAGVLVNNIQEALKNTHRYRRSALVAANKSGKIIKDSVALLKRGEGYLTGNSRSISFYTVPYQYNDRFAGLENGDYMIARPDSNTFYFYDRNQHLKRKVSVSVKSRAVTDQDLNYELKDVSENNVKNAIKNRVESQKPAFLNVWATKDYIWLKTDETQAGIQMVVLDFDGKPLGKFMLSGVDEIHQVQGNLIYTIHRSPEKGNTVRVYKVAL